MLFTVYWIRDASHTDVLKQGYVGITKRSPLRRLKEHIWNKTVPKDSILEILYENVSKETAKSIEFTLRPNVKIGWNYSEGGGKFNSICSRQGSLNVKNRKTAASTGGCSQRVQCSCGMISTKASLGRHLINNPTHGINYNVNYTL
jgi:hypothetical protein